MVPAGVVVTPHPEWRASAATVTQGSSVTSNGGGCQPGQQVIIGMGIAQADSFVMDDQVAIADAAGAYSFTIAIGADLPPRTYAVLTYGSDHGRSGPDCEATKRYSVVDVVAPWPKGRTRPHRHPGAGAARSLQERPERHGSEGSRPCCGGRARHSTSSSAASMSRR